MLTLKLPDGSAKEVPPGTRPRDVAESNGKRPAHVMARAVLRLFPGAQLAFGPATETGFYYDIDSPTPITEADFQRIEEEMRKIVKVAEPFERFERPTAEGRALCEDMAQAYKVE